MVSLTQNLLETDRLFENIAAELDISPTLYQLAVDRYTAIGNWLDEIDLLEVYEGSQDPIPAETVEANIYPQGSFAIGTVVKPWTAGGEGEYDIDLVFQIDLPIGTKQSRSLKVAVGNRLREHGTYSGMLKDEGKRCWTLEYAEQNGCQFHLDILPSLNGECRSFNPYGDTQICISDKLGHQHYQWGTSNPRGYAKWFSDRNTIAFNRVEAYERQKAFAMDHALYATVQDVPDQIIRTPLQRSVQILKRHRDVRFSGHPHESSKPISMIITTLAALAYKNEESIPKALENIINRLLAYRSLLQGGRRNVPAEGLIQLSGEGKWIIPNPVCLEENFADKWHLDNNKRARAFFEWLEWLENDLNELVTSHSPSRKNELISEQFGTRVASVVAPNTASGLIIHNASRGDTTIVEPSQPWGDGKVF